MNRTLQEELRERIVSFIAHHRTCFISTSGSLGAWAMPVRYNSQGLEVNCLVPYWADVTYFMNQTPDVMVIIQACSGTGLRWLQIQGQAHPVDAPDWARMLPKWLSTAQPDALFFVFRVTPTRMDMIDEELGWGVYETLEW